MLYGAGRLLLRLAKLALSGAGRRVYALIHRKALAAKARRVVPSIVLFAVFASLALIELPFQPQSKAPTQESARSIDLTAASDLGAPGFASVSVSDMPIHTLAPGSLPPPPVEKRHALLIGINNAVGGSPLEGAVTDALNVKEALLDYGFLERNITTLLDGQATRAAILKGLDDLAKVTPASGVAVVAIAAHSRRYGGIDQLLAADGARVDSTEIASRLQRLRSRAWIALPTCFAAGYALPGIVGHNRVATFASSGESESYELGSAGSYLIIDMVRRAIIERQAPYSVESAFDWAKQTLERTNPDRVPLMSDGVDGDLVLGDVTWGTNPVAPPANGNLATQTNGNGQRPSGDQPGPQPTPTPSGWGSVKVCWKYSFNCH